MKRSDFEMVATVIADRVREYVENEAALLEKRIGELQTQLAAAEAKAASAERRLSRHSEHLNTLESKMKRLMERGG